MQEMVHGVTTEECQAALQNHGWSVQRAIQYLKVRGRGRAALGPPPHRPCPEQCSACRDGPWFLGGQQDLSPGLCDGTKPGAPPLGVA